MCLREPIKSKSILDRHYSQCLQPQAVRHVSRHPSGLGRDTKGDEYQERNLRTRNRLGAGRRSLPRGIRLTTSVLHEWHRWMVEQPSVGTRTITAQHTGHDFVAMCVSVISSLDASAPEKWLADSQNRLSQPASLCRPTQKSGFPARTFPRDFSGVGRLGFCYAKDASDNCIRPAVPGSHKKRSRQATGGFYDVSATEKEVILAASRCC